MKRLTAPGRNVGDLATSPESAIGPAKATIGVGRQYTGPKINQRIDQRRGITPKAIICVHRVQLDVINS